MSNVDGFVWQYFAAEGKPREFLFRPHKMISGHSSHSSVSLEESWKPFTSCVRCSMRGNVGMRSIITVLIRSSFRKWRRWVNSICILELHIYIYRIVHWCGFDNWSSGPLFLKGLTLQVLNLLNYYHECFTWHSQISLVYQDFIYSEPKLNCWTRFAYKVMWIDVVWCRTKLV